MQSKVARFAYRKKKLTTADVVDRFQVPSNLASAYLCNLASIRVLKKKYKLVGGGKRWRWLFEVR